MFDQMQFVSWVYNNNGKVVEIANTVLGPLGDARGFEFLLGSSNEGDCLFSFGGEGAYLSFTTYSSRSNSMRLSLHDSHSEYLINKIGPFTEETINEQIVTRVFEYIKSKYRMPVSVLCIKAYIGKSTLFWVSKRKSSKSICKIGNLYYLAEGDGRFAKAYTSRTEWSWMQNRNLLTSKWTKHLNEEQTEYSYYHVDLWTPIYHSYNPERNILGPEVSRELNWLVEGRKRCYTRPDGSVVYTRQEMPYVKYNKTPIHGYATRIENILEQEDLFKFGSVDLYSRRDKDEVPFLGWELEACCSERVEDTAVEFRNLLDKVVFCKSDSSIGRSGFETVGIPGTLDYWKESELYNALDKMRGKPHKMRSYQHSSCGFHVHVNRTALSVLDLQKIERFMHNPHNRTFVEKIAGRGGVQYAGYYPDKMFINRKTVDRNNNGSLYPNGLRRNEPLPQDYVLRNFGSNRSMQLASQIMQCIAWSSLVPPDRQLVDNNYSLAQEGNEEAEEILIQVLLRFAGYGIAQRELVVGILSQTYPDREFTISPQFFTTKPKRELICKTKLPIGRKNNLAACHQSAGPVGKSANGRYDILNTSNENTVEFRLFKGTMNPDSVFRYLEFVDALVRFVPATSAQDTGLRFENFVQWLVKDSFNVVRYEHLVAFLVTNSFIARKDIRKKDVKTTVELDTGLPETIVSNVTSNPCAEINTILEEVDEIQASWVNDEEDEENDPEQEMLSLARDFDPEGCPCNLCVRNRERNREIRDLVGNSVSGPAVILHEGSSTIYYNYNSDGSTWVSTAPPIEEGNI